MASGGKRPGSGPKPTPTNLRILRGNPGRRPLNEDEPKPPRALPPVPDWFNLLEREAWDTVIAALEPMGVVTLSDGPALTLLAQTWAEWREARGTIDLEGNYYAANGWVRKHPAVGVAANAWRRVASMLAEFGLTPAARTRVQMIADGDPDPFDKFRARRRRPQV